MFGADFSFCRTEKPAIKNQAAVNAGVKMKKSLILFTLLLLFTMNNNAFAKGVVILECKLYSEFPPSPPYNRIVSRVSSSVVLPKASTVSLGESCSVALAKILKANFTIASVNVTADSGYAAGDDSLVYTLVSIL